MNKHALRFCGNLESSQEASELRNYQPCTFPPPDDFYVSVDKDGNPLSKYSDDRWDFSAYGSKGFNFGKHKLTSKNNDLLKQLIFLYLYHMPLFPGKVQSVNHPFYTLAKLCKLADSHNVSVDQLYRFPRLAGDVMKYFQPAQHEKLFGVLNSLLRSEEFLGWKIADAAFIEELARHRIPHINTQSAYIPPRLWMSLIQSTETVMDAFQTHQAAFEKAWVWISNAYRHNIENGYSQMSPFHNSEVDVNYINHSSRKPRRVYPGGSKAFFENYGIANLLNQWVGYVPDPTHDTTALSSYANLVRDCAFTFILAHSIQRVGEGLSLRSDCFHLDYDPTLGNIGLLVGETTKTDPDSDARWVVPTSVERAVNILKFLGHLRIDNTFKSVTQEFARNPYLMTGQIECWHRGSTSLNLSQWGLGKFVEKNPLVFEEANFSITEEDYKIAYQLTPRLTEKSWFKVGGIWSFSAHQLRRTLAVNLFTSDVPESVIQWMMKHKSLNQSYYYGRNYTRLRMNTAAEQAVVTESYRATIRNLSEIADNTLGENVHATGNNLINVDTLNLIEKRDHKKLEALAKKGEIAARQTLLGFCMTQSCEYGGVESAVHCAGVDGSGPCKDAVFSKRNRKRLKIMYDNNAEELNDLVENTPRHSKLKAENEAIEVYFHATS